jgi:hypothetical protein
VVVVLLRHLYREGFFPPAELAKCFKRWHTIHFDVRIHKCFSLAKNTSIL